MKITREHDILGFDLAFAYEAMARALAYSEKANESTTAKKSATEAADGIEKKEARDYFLDTLEKGPWPESPSEFR